MIYWTCKLFSDLTPDELYAILRLRSEVFVVEQQCIFLDMDNKDQKCHHLMGRRDGLLVGYSRVLRAGISYVESSIGRIVTSPMVRREGVGRELLNKSIDILYTLHGRQSVRIGAQLYLKAFYESFGFVQKGEIYLEDGIEHIEMLLL